MFMTNAVFVYKERRACGMAFFSCIPRWGRVFLFFWLALAVLLPASSRLYGQGSIRYEARDLADVNVGEDLWEYSYFFSGFNFQAGQGFSLYFDPRFYSRLQNARPSLSVDWNMIAVQPDVVLQAPGFLDGLALVSQPSTGVPFQVTFVWLGQGAPGGQPFDIHDASFATLISGASVVPEPGSLLLGGLGGLVLVGSRVWGMPKKRSKAIA